MKKTISIAIVSGVLALLVAQDRDRPAQRQVNQQKRVMKGVANDELTRKEVKNIERREAKLHKQIVHDRKDGKGLTAVEKAKIEAEQDAMSKSIKKQANDGQKQKN